MGEWNTGISITTGRTSESVREIFNSGLGIGLTGLAQSVYMWGAIYSVPVQCTLWVLCSTDPRGVAKKPPYGFDFVEVIGNLGTYRSNQMPRTKSTFPGTKISTKYRRCGRSSNYSLIDLHRVT